MASPVTFSVHRGYEALLEFYEQSRLLRFIESKADYRPPSREVMYYKSKHGKKNYVRVLKSGPEIIRLLSLPCTETDVLEFRRRDGDIDDASD